jgi:uncharacterized protein YndB with AHSA1/START domain
MSTAEPFDAVRKTILVRCPVEVAFQVWTERIDQWWPKAHSRSGDLGTQIYLEPRAGGRLYERTPDGTEYVWGEVLVWEPPRHLAYHWYLGSSAEQPTRVDVQFSPHAQSGTQVDITHRGPELIGERWARTQERFVTAWEHVLTAYAAACDPLEEKEDNG